MANIINDEAVDEDENECEDTQQLLGAGQTEKAPGATFIPMRYVMIALIAFGHMNNIGMRLNLSTTLVAMVNSTDSGGHNNTRHNTSDICPKARHFNSTSDPQEGEFHWDTELQGDILSAYYYGYMVAQVPAGFLATKFGGRWVYGPTVLLSSILSFLTPMAAYQGPGYLIAVRVLLGLSQGGTFPGAYALIGAWVPPRELSTLLSLAAVGVNLGGLLYPPLSGYLTTTDLFGGWPSVFYISGIVGICWFFFWLFLGYSHPSEHPCISQGELESIENSFLNRRVPKENLRIPWCALLTSLPVIAMTVCQFGAEFGYFIFTSDLPAFFKRVQGFDITNTGFLTGIPFVLQIFWEVSSGVLADVLINKKILKKVTVRKMLTTVCLCLEGVLFVLAAYAGCHAILSAVFITVSLSLGGLLSAGLYANKLDLAPQYAGVMSGMVNTLTTFGGIVGPMMVGIITENNETITQWRLIFWITAVIYFFGVIIFDIFASGELQPWARDKVLEVDEQTSTNDASKVLPGTIQA